MDARALPIIGMGIVLSGIPDFLARLTALALAVFIVALLLLEWALVHFWSRQAG